MKKFAFRWTWRSTAVAGALLLALVAGTFAVTTRLQAQEPYDNRITLGREVVKLAIVVMANQTPVTATDATGILPVLEEIRAQDKISEEQAAVLHAKLYNALSSPLKEAVNVVRLPEPRPEAKARIQQFLERRRPGNPAKYGPGSHAFDRLVEFFENTAAGK